MRDAALMFSRWCVPAAALLLCAFGMAGCQSSGSAVTQPAQEAAGSDSPAAREPLGIDVDVAGAGNSAGMGVSVDLSQLLKATRGTAAPPVGTNAAPPQAPTTYPKAIACTGTVAETMSTQAVDAVSR